jgi:plasmid maintenance system antidote protein VapI
VIKYLYNKKPEMWKELQQEYDKENTYVKKYENKLKEITT